MQAVIDDRALSKLRWRCRRGLLENDLLIERFFTTHGTAITTSQAEGLQVLMDLSDNDLLDLLLRRTESPEHVVSQVFTVGAALRTAASAAGAAVAGLMAGIDPLLVLACSGLVWLVSAAVMLTFPRRR